jgi:hypothetical protein
MVRNLLWNWRFWATFCVGVTSSFFFFIFIGILPTHVRYCSYQGGYKDCTGSLLVLYPALWIIDHLDLVAAFITAVATYYIARFTNVIRSINSKQLATTGDVERAYLSGGGAPEIQRIDRGAQTVPGTTGGSTTIHLGYDLRPTGYFRLDINNHGKTRGNILEYGYGFCERDKVNELPAKPDYRWVYYYDQIGPGTQSRPIKRVKIPETKSVIFGRYGYLDIFGERHSDGFIQDGGTPIAPPHRAYTEADPSWDLANVGKRNYQKEEPQS